MLQGWTKAYSRISDVGIGAYLAYFALYMALVELGIYWMHRLLHDIRPGYRQATPPGLLPARLHAHALCAAWSAPQYSKGTCLLFCCGVHHLCRDLKCRCLQQQVQLQQVWQTA